MPRLSTPKPRVQTLDTRRAHPPPKQTESFYRSPEWRDLLARLIRERGRRCEMPGCGAGGPGVRIFGDHVHEISEGGARLDPRNVRLICAACHNRKTAAARAVRSAEGARRPDDVPPNIAPPSIPVTMVSGPPGAGKTTYVRTHARPHDVVIDLDDILVRIGARPWTNDTGELARALAYRDAMLKGLSTKRKGRRAWFVIGAPSPYQRDAWAKALRTTDVVVLRTDADTCKARIAADPARAHARDRLITAVDDWFRRAG